METKQELITTNRYECIDCKKLKHLISVRSKNGGYANRCEECYKKYWKNRTIHTKALRDMNKVAVSITK